MALLGKATFDCPGCAQPIELTVDLTSSTVRDGVEIHVAKADWQPIRQHLDESHPEARTT